MQSSKAHAFRFSRRTDWSFGENELSRIGREVRGEGREVLDLTASNPTRAGIAMPLAGLAAAFDVPALAEYSPDPWGLPATRAAVCADHSARGVDVGMDRVMLTSSTSEAYNYIFRLLCDVYDEVLAPAPSYPLFQFLADVNDVRLRNYGIVQENGLWRIDRQSIAGALSPRTKAILLVNPNNPTGSYVRADDLAFLRNLATERGLALISDEVFGEYAIAPAKDAVPTLAGTSEGPLTFVLGGLSKALAMPQMKLAWLLVGGDETLVRDACQRLEIIADTFLSVNAPVQLAFGQWIQRKAGIQAAIMERLRANMAVARAIGSDLVSALHVEGGWYVVMSLPGVGDEDAFFERLLSERAVLAHPGYYYDFSEGSHAVLSLLTPTAIFEKGLSELASAAAAL